jgi:ElaA protein
VLTSSDARGSGLGRELVARAIALVEAIWPHAGVRISAQSRLEAFYASLGFVAVGPRYLEDGIDHTEMLRPSGARLRPGSGG